MNLILRPMTPHAEILLSLLRENAHVTTEQARGAGVKGVVDAVATLLDHGHKVRADFNRAVNCIRYRLVAPDAGRDITSVLGPRSEVKDAARRGIGKAVWEIVKDGNWRTPEEVGAMVGISASRAASAFRRFGYSDRVRFRVEKRHCQLDGIKYEYRITRMDT